MMLIQKRYLVPLLLTILVSIIQLASTKTMRRIISLKHKTDIIENYHIAGSSSFVFGTCDAARWKLHERSCTFALQTKKSMDSLDHVKICDFEIKSNSNSTDIGKILQVHSFGEDKAIVTWMGKHDFIRFGILNFDNCTAIVSKIDDDLNIDRGHILTTEEDIFDVVVRQYGTQCAHFAHSRMILDSEGKLVTNLTDWLCSEKPQILAAIYSPLKGHLVVDAASILKKNVRIIEVNKNVTVLKEYSNYESFGPTVAISHTQEQLSICYQVSLLSFNCSQYDQNGELKFETSVEFQNPPRAANIYNLPDGGFLLLGKENIRSDKMIFHKTDPKNFIVTKFNETGGLVKIVEMPNEFGNTVDLKKIHFHIAENNEHCFSYVFDSLLEQADKLVDLMVSCFADSSLTKLN